MARSNIGLTTDPYSNWLGRSKGGSTPKIGLGDDLSGTTDTKDIYASWRKGTGSSHAGQSLDGSETDPLTKALQARTIGLLQNTPTSIYQTDEEKSQAYSDAIRRFEEAANVATQSAKEQAQASGMFHSGGLVGTTGDIGKQLQQEKNAAALELAKQEREFQQSAINQNIGTAAGVQSNIATQGAQKAQLGLSTEAQYGGKMVNGVWTPTLAGKAQTSTEIQAAGQVPLYNADGTPAMDATTGQQKMGTTLEAQKLGLQTAETFGGQTVNGVWTPTLQAATTAGQLTGQFVEPGTGAVRSTLARTELMGGTGTSVTLSQGDIDSAYGTSKGQAGYRADLDLNGDGTVGADDLQTLLGDANNVTDLGGGQFKVTTQGQRTLAGQSLDQNATQFAQTFGLEETKVKDAMTQFQTTVQVQMQQFLTNSTGYVFEPDAEGNMVPAYYKNADGSQGDPVSTLDRSKWLEEASRLNDVFTEGQYEFDVNAGLTKEQLALKARELNIKEEELETQKDQGWASMLGGALFSIVKAVIPGASALPGTGSPVAQEVGISKPTVAAAKPIAGAAKVAAPAQVGRPTADEARAFLATQGVTGTDAELNDILTNGDPNVRIAYDNWANGRSAGAAAKPVFDRTAVIAILKQNGQEPTEERIKEVEQAWKDAGYPENMAYPGTEKGVDAAGNSIVTGEPYVGATPQQQSAPTAEQRYKAGMQLATALGFNDQEFEKGWRDATLGPAVQPAASTVARPGARTSLTSAVTSLPGYLKIAVPQAKTSLTAAPATPAGTTPATQTGLTVPTQPKTGQPATPVNPDDAQFIKQMTDKGFSPEHAAGFAAFIRAKGQTPNPTGDLTELLFEYQNKMYPMYTTPGQTGTNTVQGPQQGTTQPSAPPQVGLATTLVSAGAQKEGFSADQATKFETFLKGKGVNSWEDYQKLLQGGTGLDLLFEFQKTMPAPPAATSPAPVTNPQTGQTGVLAYLSPTDLSDFQLYKQNFIAGYGDRPGTSDSEWLRMWREGQSTWNASYNQAPMEVGPAPPTTSTTQSGLTVLHGKGEATYVQPESAAQLDYNLEPDTFLTHVRGLWSQNKIDGAQYLQIMDEYGKRNPQWAQSPVVAAPAATSTAISPTDIGAIYQRVLAGKLSRAEAESVLARDPTALANFRKLMGG